MAIKAVFFDIGDTLVSGKTWLPGAKDLLKQLKEQGMRVGLISNTGDLLREELAKNYLPEDFEFEWFEESLVLLSSEVGVQKPELAIFNMAIAHAKCSPWETLFVAETIPETFGAQQAGMQAIRLCDAAKDLPAIGKLLKA